MAGGKDIKFGHDKRPISTFTNTEQNLYNYQTGKPLLDESGAPLITEQEEFFLSDATSERSTSVTFDDENSSVYGYTKHSFVGMTTATYGVDLDVYVGTASSLTVFQRDGNVVGAGTTVIQRSSYEVPIIGHPGSSPFDGNVEVKTTAEFGGKERNRLYFPDSVGIQTVLGVKLGDKITGSNIPDGTFVTRVDRGRLIISNDVTLGAKTDKVRIRRSERAIYKVDNIIKVEEVFKESSEVSSTLLGVDRAEVQLSLFSNVSSYGLDDTEFEYYTWVGGLSLGEWRTRSNLTYGKHYDAKVGENTMESAITLESYPTPYSYPWGPNFQDVGWYDQTRFELYRKFITMGNELYNYFANNTGGQGWGMDWANNFLDPSIVRVIGNDVEYLEGIVASFEKIDTWTDTWRSIKDNPDFVSPDGNTFNDLAIAALDRLVFSGDFKTSTTRPGYDEDNRRYATLQSRRVFRYQPGRISGFTFGVKTSDEPVAGYVIEWGISNPTDAYMFHIYGGQISIRRRSTIPLDNDSIARSGLDPLDTSVEIDGIFYNTIQPQIEDGDPYGINKPLYTLDIPRDKWNGDRLDGNGTSGYQIQMDRVTMWKIEFGWYGAIGARFYAYVPVDAGDARWVVVHTIVIENSVGQPCLEDSYFRLRYINDITNTAAIKKPCFIYKYGASYYIDGGDEGTQTVYSVNSGIKSTFTSVQKPIIGITPKTFMTSSDGTEIPNRKLIIPKKVNISADSLTEIQVVTVKGGPGFAHAYTPGVASTITGRDIYANFTSGNTISAIAGPTGDGSTDTNTYFYETDIGAKLVSAGGLYNWYISDVSGDAGAGAPARDGYPAKNSATVLGFGPGGGDYPNYHPISGNREIAGNEVKDNIAGIVTTTPNGGGDPSAGIGSFAYPIRLSNYVHEFASDFKFTGSKIEIQFLNPVSLDGSGTHYGDFYIGLTDKTPVVSSPDVLVEWSGVNWTDLDGNVQVGVNTTFLPKGIRGISDNVLGGEFNHDYAGFDKDGVETSEAIWDRGKIALRMGIDDRIPSPPGSGSGKCSKVLFEVLDPVAFSGISETDGHPDPDDSTPGKYIVREPGVNFPSSINDFDGGQIAVENAQGNIVTTNSRFEGTVNFYVNDENKKVYYIKISETLGKSGQFSIYVRPVQRTAGVMRNKTKLFNYEPWPLYLTGCLKDNTAINSITVKETVGEFERTITPRLYVKGNITVTNANNNASTLGEAPPHYQEVHRLSSALYDKQDEQTLRPGIVRDTFYVGSGDSKDIDMSKIFNPDRDSITPDNQNIEATFFVAEKIDSGSAGQIQATVTYTEQ